MGPEEFAQTIRESQENLQGEFQDRLQRFEERCQEALSPGEDEDAG